jgi:hypothetical protein
VVCASTADTVATTVLAAEGDASMDGEVDATRVVIGAECAAALAAAGAASPTRNRRGPGGAAAGDGGAGSGRRIHQLATPALSTSSSNSSARANTV